jgi:hypothetical protein
VIGASRWLDANTLIGDENISSKVSKREMDRFMEFS